MACHRVSHVVRMDDYFQSTREYVEDYCGRCVDAYDKREGYCDLRCLSNCESYYDATDYSDYYGCAGPYKATDDSVYYFRPVCSASGGVSRGYFLDFNESQS